MNVSDILSQMLMLMIESLSLYPPCLFRFLFCTLPTSTHSTHLVFSSDSTPSFDQEHWDRRREENEEVRKEEVRDRVPEEDVE